MQTQSFGVARVDTEDRVGLGTGEIDHPPEVLGNSIPHVFLSHVKRVFLTIGVQKVLDGQKGVLFSSAIAMTLRSKPNRETKTQSPTLTSMMISKRPHRVRLCKLWSMRSMVSVLSSIRAFSRASSSGNASSKTYRNRPALEVRKVFAETTRPGLRRKRKRPFSHLALERLVQEPMFGGGSVVAFEHHGVLQEFEVFGVDRQVFRADLVVFVFREIWAGYSLDWLVVS